MPATSITRLFGPLARKLLSTTATVATWSRWLALFLAVAVTATGCKMM